MRYSFAPPGVSTQSMQTQHQPLGGGGPEGAPARLVRAETVPLLRNQIGREIIPASALLGARAHKNDSALTKDVRMG